MKQIFLEFVENFIDGEISNLNIAVFVFLLSESDIPFDKSLILQSSASTSDNLKLLYKSSNLFILFLKSRISLLLRKSRNS